MNEKKSIVYNYAMNIILTMSSFIFPLITFPYASRMLKPEGMGKVVFSTSVISYFILISQMGIPKYGIRECAKVKDDRLRLEKTVQELIVINIVMCLCAYILLAAAIIFVPRLKNCKIILEVMSISILFTTLGVEWFYQALEKYTYITVRSIIFKFVAMLAMFLLIHEEKDYVIYGGISIFASSASGILNFLNLNKYIHLFSKKKLDIKKHIKPILIFFSMTCATTIYLNMDVVMLGFMQTDTEVGVYNAAIKIKSVLVSVIIALGTVLLPRVTYYIEKGKVEKLYNIAKRAIQFVYFLTLPLIMVFTVCAKDCILILAGSDYGNAELPMKIMLPTVFFIGLTNVMGIEVLIPTGNEIKVLISEVIGAIVNLIFNFTFIPKYGAIGAAIGTLLAEMAVFAVQFILYKEVFTKIFRKVHIMKNIISLLVAILVSKLIFKGQINGIVFMIKYGIVFGGIYIISLYLLKDEFMKAIVEFLNRKLPVIGKR